MAFDSSFVRSRPQCGIVPMPYEAVGPGSCHLVLIGLHQLEMEWILRKLLGVGSGQRVVHKLALGEG